MDEKQIAQTIFVSGGGESSELRQPSRARLGHPVTGQIFIPLADADYAGQIWLHEIGEASPLQDNDSGQRENSPSAIFTALLKKNTIPENLIKFGTQVRLKVVDNILEVDDLDGITAEEYLVGTPQQTVLTSLEQIDFALLRPTDPPSGRCIVSGGLYFLDGTAYLVPDLLTSDLIAAYASTPGAGQAVAVQVLLDPLTNTLSYTASSAFTDNRDANGISDHAALFGSYPATVSSTKLNIGWAKIYAGMLQVVTEDLLPGSEWISKNAGGVSIDAGSVTYAPNTLTDWTGSADPGNVDDALDQLADRMTIVEGSALISNFPDLGDVDDLTTPTLNHVPIGDGTKWQNGFLGSDQLPVVPATKGGTGQAGYAVGDILYAVTATGLGKLNVGANDQILRLISGVPAWDDENTGAGGASLEYWYINGADGLSSLSGSPQLFTGFSFALDSAGYDNTDDVTIPTGYDGVYFVAIGVSFYANGSSVGKNYVNARLLRNSSQYKAEGNWNDAASGVSDESKVYIFALINLNASDVLEVDAALATGSDTIDASIRFFLGVKLT